MKYTAHEFAAARYSVYSDSYAAGAAVEGGEVDTKGYRELLWLFILGEFQATATVTFQGMECDTSGGTFADVTGAVTTALAAGTADDELYTGRIELMKRLRYQLIEYTIANDAVEFSVVGVLLDGVNMPASQSNTNIFTV